MKTSFRFNRKAGYQEGMSFIVNCRGLYLIERCAKVNQVVFSQQNFGLLPLKSIVVQYYYTLMPSQTKKKVRNKQEKQQQHLDFHPCFDMVQGQVSCEKQRGLFSSLIKAWYTHTYAKVCSGKNNKVEINFHQNFRANDLTNEAVCQLKKYLPKVCNSKSI